MRPGEPFPQDPAFRTVSRTVMSRDGTQLSWHVHVPPEKTEADLAGRRTVVLTNGIGTTERFWKHPVRDLVQSFRVVHWNYRGHGASASSARGDYRIETHADDLVRVTQAAMALAEADGRAPVHVGFSMGVVVALEAYRVRPELFSALVLLAGGADAPWRNTALFRVPGVALALRGALAALAPAVPLAAPVVRAITASRVVYPVGTLTGLVRKHAPRDEVEHLMYEMGSMDLRAFWGSLRGLMGARASDVLAQIDVPTLVLTAEHDVFVPPRETELLIEKIRPVRAVELRDAGHAALAEAGPEIARHLRAFLEDPAVR